MRVRLTSGRRYSAVMASLDHSGIDHDLVAAASRVDTPVLVVGDVRRGPNGVAAQVGTAPGVLAAAVGAVATPVREVDQPPEIGGSAGSGPEWRARLVAVCGPGGTGTSTVAGALAAGMAGEWPAGRGTGSTATSVLPAAGGSPSGSAGTGVLLADLALRADQAWLHGLAQPSRCLLDLVRACRQPGRAGARSV